MVAKHNSKLRVNTVRKTDGKLAIIVQGEKLMTKKQIAELVYGIAGARILISKGDIEGAQGLLDVTAGIVPDDLFAKELAAFEKLYNEVHS